MENEKHPLDDLKNDEITKKQTNINSDDNMPPPETTPYYNIP